MQANTQSPKNNNLRIFLTGWFLLCYCRRNGFRSTLYISSQPDYERNASADFSKSVGEVLFHESW